MYIQHATHIDSVGHGIRKPKLLNAKWEIWKGCFFNINLISTDWVIFINYKWKTIANVGGKQKARTKITS